jgi:hypothetical protein
MPKSAADARRMGKLAFCYETESEIKLSGSENRTCSEMAHVVLWGARLLSGEPLRSQITRLRLTSCSHVDIAAPGGLPGFTYNLSYA